MHKNPVLAARVTGVAATVAGAFGIVANSVHAAADTALVASATAGSTGLLENAQAVLGEMYVPGLIVGAGVGLFYFLRKQAKAGASGR